MKKSFFALCRTFLFVVLGFTLFESLVACSPDELYGTDNENTVMGGDTADKDDKPLCEIPEGAVDLGLSVFWASCNVGAISPEEYGGYYAWGETEEKGNYLPSTYMYSNTNIGSDIAGTDYDVAYKKLGNGWRMPTKEEYVELCEQCNWQWETVNGINGYRVVGLNGNSIFLPAAGYRYGTMVDYLGMRGTDGYYWSSTEISVKQAYCLHFNNTKNLGMGTNGHNPYDGHTIRPVFGGTSGNKDYILQLVTQDHKISYKATTIDVELKSNVSFEYIILEDSWIRELKLVTSTSGIHNIVFNVDENTSSMSRKGRIAFYNSEYDLSDTLTLVQGGKPNSPTYEAVDLGLSVKWASCNVGANSPEERGDFFAWGETSSKSGYYGSNSVTYDLSISELKSRGIIGSDGNLTAEYDAATVNWGGTWRMPTLDEIEELVNDCIWEWITQNGVIGCKVTGSNGNSIFLPITGCRYDMTHGAAISEAHYWSATPSSSSNSSAHHLIYFYLRRYECRDSSRDYGRTVRPVSK